MEKFMKAKQKTRHGSK